MILSDFKFSFKSQKSSDYIFVRVSSEKGCLFTNNYKVGKIKNRGKVEYRPDVVGEYGFKNMI